MGKVVTNAGTEIVPNHKAATPGEAPKLQTTQAAPLIDMKSANETKPETESVERPKADEHVELTEDEKTLPEKAQAEIQRAKRAVHKKHAELMQALAEAEADQRLAEGQYDARRLAESKLETAEARLREFEAKAQTAVVEKVKPTIDDKKPDGSFKYRDAQGNVDWDTYTDDKAEFAADSKFKERQAQADREASEKATATRIEAIKANAEAVRKEHPDYDEVMRRAAAGKTDIVPQYVLNYLYESDNPAGVAYFLAMNPAESQRIAKLKPITGIRELGKIEDSLSVKPNQAANAPAAPGATPKPGAPPPITPISGSGNGAINQDPSKMDFKQLRAYERARRTKQ